jgi:hypothetical protein
MWMRFDRLDRVALIVIGVLIAATALVVLRGDQVGAAVVRSSPAADAAAVSTRSLIAFTFAEPMDVTASKRDHPSPARCAAAARPCYSFPRNRSKPTHAIKSH